MICQIPLKWKPSYEGSGSKRPGGNLSIRILNHIISRNFFFLFLNDDSSKSSEMEILTDIKDNSMLVDI